MVRSRTWKLSRHRSGFTIIELLMVIVVIAVLVAFLLPAVQSARQRARDVQVKTDISSLDGAVSRFKVDFLIEPPSGIVLYEHGADWATNATAPAVVKSRAILRQLWPQFDFTIDRDINQNGTKTETFQLAGAECMVLFLGGVPGAGGAMTGFSKNPVDPFAAGGNRQGPFYEFNTNRLLASPTNSGLYVYKDPLPNQRSPYVYISSYGGTGYQIADLGTGGLGYWYVQGTVGAGPAWNATKFQIISPGSDGIYGAGGPYSSSNNPTLPAWSLTSPAITVTTAQRQVENDNITNFASGRLGNN